MDINLLVNIFTVVVVVAAAGFVGKNRGNKDALTQANESVVAWREENAAVRTRADRLHDDLDNALDRENKLLGRLSKLESLPDMTLLLEEMKAQREWGEKQSLSSMKTVAEMFEGHETRANERHNLIVQSFTELNRGLSSINDSLQRLNSDTREDRQQDRTDRHADMQQARTDRHADRQQDRVDRSERDSRDDLLKSR